MLPFQLLNPIKNEMDKWLNLQNADHINEYIQNVISKSIPSSFQQNNVKEEKEMFNQDSKSQTQEDVEEIKENKSQNLDIQTFETHDHVYIKIFIKEHSQLANLKIYHTSNQSILEGYPTLEDRHVITLPALVKGKGSKAEYRDQYLQIQLPKKIDMQYTEIDVQGLD
ncbi:hypothetical protein [Metabacillus litoralis]|uniref:hypothetical protein n=1 Tax=Metabacillus litoralis TaxID=152268 RepID=UPI001CFEBADE|nr:hypothetical protein [Metabacillus litoralis]